MDHAGCLELVAANAVGRIACTVTAHPSASRQLRQRCRSDHLPSHRERRDLLQALDRNYAEIDDSASPVGVCWAFGPPQLVAAAEVERLRLGICGALGPRAAADALPHAVPAADRTRASQHGALTVMSTAAGSSARVLVAVASKMGSTAEIAEAAAARLRAGSHEATVVPMGEAPGPEAFDAVVVGSSVHIRGWEKAALRYLTRHQDALRVRPTYLFESGPSGDRSESEHTTSAEVRRLAEKIGCRPPMVFGGNVDPKRAVVRLAKWVASRTWPGLPRLGNDTRGQLRSPAILAGMPGPRTPEH